jgi:sugar lactone lactonase YvrE
MKRLLLAIVVLLSAIGALPASVAAAEPSEPVLARGAALHGANGMMFDRHDRLHIASVAGREIVVMDPETGAILDRYGPDQGVEGPDDLTFGPDGALYWTSFFTGVVGRRAPDGTVSTVAQLPPGVGAIAFSDDGRLFVALSTLGDALYELDPSGANSPRLIASDLGGLNSMDWGSDGLLYGPLNFRGQVVRINVDTGAIAPVAGGFGLPTAVKFDSQGRLYVVDQLSLDQQHGEVVHVDIATGAKTVIAQLTPGLDSLAFDSHDRLLVSSFHDGFIVEIKPDGMVRTVSRSGMILPGGVAALPRGRDNESVFVADLFSLRELDARTGRQRSIERGLPGSSELISPVFTVAPDGGNLLLTSSFLNMVQVWDPAAHSPVATYTDFAGPLNAIRFQGDLVVAELETGGVVRARGANPAERVTLAAGLGVPVGLAATDDDLWVGDWAAGSVLQLVADGRPLARPRVVARRLAAPEGLAIAPDRSLLVVESGAGRLSRIDLKTGQVSTVADGLALGAQGIPGVPGVPPTWSFNGVAVGQSGALYLTGDKANVLYSLNPGASPMVD